METNIILEYVFKGAITIGVGLMIYTLKDFKASLVKLTDSLTAVTLSLRELIVKDENKSEKLTEMKNELKTIQSRVTRLEVEVSRLKHKE